MRKNVYIASFLDLSEKKRWKFRLDRSSIRNYNIVENDYLIALEAMFNQSWSVGEKKIYFNALVTVIHLPEDAETVTLDSIFHRGRSLNFVDSNMILRNHNDVDIIPTVVVQDTDTQIMNVMLQVIYGKRACKL